MRNAKKQIVTKNLKPTVQYTTSQSSTTDEVKQLKKVSSKNTLVGGNFKSLKPTTANLAKNLDGKHGNKVQARIPSNEPIGKAIRMKTEQTSSKDLNLVSKMSNDGVSLNKIHSDKSNLQLDKKQSKKPQFYENQQINKNYQVAEKHSEKIKNLQQQLQAKQQQISTLNQTNNILKAKLEKFKKNAQDRKKALTKQINCYNEQGQQLRNLNNKLISLQSQNDLLKQRLSKISKNCQNASETNHTIYSQRQIQTDIESIQDYLSEKTKSLLQIHSAPINETTNKNRNLDFCHEEFSIVIQNMSEQKNQDKAIIATCLQQLKNNYEVNIQKIRTNYENKISEYITKLLNQQKQIYELENQLDQILFEKQSNCQTKPSLDMNQELLESIKTNQNYKMLIKQKNQEIENLKFVVQKHQYTLESLQNDIAILNHKEHLLVNNTQAEYAIQIQILKNQISQYSAKLQQNIIKMESLQQENYKKDQLIKKLSIGNIRKTNVIK